MRVTFTRGDLQITADGQNQKEVFSQLAELQEVFDNIQCGYCKDNNIRFVVRTVDDNNYFEIQCRNKDCRAKLAFGQHKKGESLFPKRKDDEGNWLSNNGWQKWAPPVEKAE